MDVRTAIGAGDAVMTPKGVATVLFVEPEVTRSRAWWVEGAEDGIVWQDYFEEEHLTLLVPADGLARLDQLYKDVRAARNYAGDNLPASKGLTMIHMLEEALAKARSPRRTA